MAVDGIDEDGIDIDLNHDVFVAPSQSLGGLPSLVKEDGVPYIIDLVVDVAQFLAMQCRGVQDFKWGRFGFCGPHVLPC